ncbi:hypothetical protein ACLOJK_020958 [Asimina triloba]
MILESFSRSSLPPPKLYSTAAFDFGWWGGGSGDAAGVASMWEVLVVGTVAALVGHAGRDRMGQELVGSIDRGRWSLPLRELLSVALVGGRWEEALPIAAESPAAICHDAEEAFAAAIIVDVAGDCGDGLQSRWIWTTRLIVDLLDDSDQPIGASPAKMMGSESARHPRYFGWLRSAVRTTAEELANGSRGCRPRRRRWSTESGASAVH